MHSLDSTASPSRIHPLLSEQFLDPPRDVRAMVRWWWFGTDVTDDGIDTQIEAMKRAGLGGVELAFVYPLTPDQPCDFASPEFLPRVAHAAKTAADHGLRFDLTLGSGWSYGGSHVPSEFAARRLRWELRTLDSRATRIPLPGRWPDDELIAAYLSEGATGESTGRFVHVELDGDVAVIPPGNGPRALLVATSGTTGQVVKRASQGAVGPVLDHYSSHAVTFHLDAIGEALLTAARSGGPVTAVFCDSLEVYDSDWTPDVLEQFAARRGYSALPHLPHLRETGVTGATFRSDFYSTLSELYEERFLQTVQAWALRRNVRFRVQNYGQPPATASGYRFADMIEGEGWGWKGIPQARWAASAAHHLSVGVVSAEAWTWVNSPSFRARPIDLKAEAHEHFLSGINHLIGHGWPYSPSNATPPGWAFYASGAICDRNGWWSVAPDLFGYLQRMSLLLQQGDQVADIGLWLPYDNAYASFRHGEDLDLWKRCAAIIGAEVPAALRVAGYDFDVIDRRTPVESILRRHRVVVVAAEIETDSRDSLALQEIENAGIPVVTLPAGVPGTTEPRDPVSVMMEKIAEIIAPDVRVEGADSDVGVIHRRLDSGELYVVVNTSPVTRSVRLAARTVVGDWEAWDLRTSSVRSGVGAIDLRLDAYQCIVVATRTTEHPVVDEPRLATEHPAEDVLLENWQFCRPDGLSTLVRPPHQWELDGLDSFSGSLTYSTTVRLEDDIPDLFVLDTASLEIPPNTATQTHSYQAQAAMPIGEVAALTVNGTLAGRLWDPPFQLPVKDLLHSGENRLSLTVSNSSVPLMRSPEWLEVYEKAEGAHGRRFVMQDLDKIHDQTTSGLFVAPVLRHSPRVPRTQEPQRPKEYSDD